MTMKYLKEDHQVRILESFEHRNGRKRDDLSLRRKKKFAKCRHGFYD
jgi:hypothetical protein